MDPRHVLIWQLITLFVGGATVVISLAFGQTLANAFGAGSVLFILSFLTVMVVNSATSRRPPRS